jgi:hypothetical protein
MSDVYGDDFSFELPNRRPVLLPDEVFLLGKDAGNHYLPLEVDSEDRLVAQYVNPEYIARLPVLVPTAVTEIEDTAGFVYEVNVVNYGGATSLLYLYYETAGSTPGATKCIHVCTLAAGELAQVQLYLEIGTKVLWANASVANQLRLHCSMTKGPQAVRG